MLKPKNCHTVKLWILSIAVFIILGHCSFLMAQQKRQLGQSSQIKASNESRMALVIGNSKYETSPLKNPINDAIDMANILKKLGFEVYSYLDLNQTEMKKAIREFGLKLRAKGGIGLFYYAGHGVQVKGRNYLIPVAAKVTTEEEVEYESVEMGLVLSHLETAKNGINIVILDACRNNPFARSYRSSEKGLASINAPSGTLIAYSTAPGSVAADGAGRNGIYTQELLKQIQILNLKIEGVFKRVRANVQQQSQGKQIPWESSSIINDFYFAYDQNKPIKPTYQPNENIAKQTITPSEDASKHSSSMQRKKEAFFTFEIQKCVKAGVTVTCDFTVTNNDSEGKPFEISNINPSGLIDDSGNEARMIGSQVANKSGYDRTILLTGVPIKAKFTFTGIDENSKEVKRLIISFRTKVSQTIENGFRVEFRNIPLD